MRTATSVRDLGFRLVREIGRGAHSTISLAIERDTQRAFAIKHVVRRAPKEDRFIEQAENEFEVARRADHPCLRRCFDLVRIRKWLKTRELFLIMEYVDGEILERCCPNQLSQVVTIFQQIAAGLHALHLEGFAHADVKPKNVLLCVDKGLKIIDFGQSCPLGHKKQRVQGTPEYMAPEQVLREPIDQRTDVFGLGATMYWLLTGRPLKTLMPTPNPTSRLIAIESRSENTPPHELNHDIPLPLSMLIMECCQMRAADRPQDMRQIISRLEVIQHILSRNQPSPDGEGGQASAALAD